MESISLQLHSGRLFRVEGCIIMNDIFLQPQAVSSYTVQIMKSKITSKKRAEKKCMQILKSRWLRHCSSSTSLLYKIRALMPSHVTDSLDVRT